MTALGRTRIKFCGFTRHEDVAQCRGAGGRCAGVRHVAQERAGYRPCHVGSAGSTGTGFCDAGGAVRQP